MNVHYETNPIFDGDASTRRHDDLAVQRQNIRSRRWCWIAAAVIVAITAAVLWPVVTFDFIEWDDGHNILQHPHVRSATVEDVLWHWQNPTAGLFIPLTYTIWALLAQVGDAPNPAVYHTANLLLHALAAVMVYVVVQRLIQRRTVATLAALLFALHPVQVESVAWVSGMKDVLFGLLTLTAVWQFIVFAQTPLSMSRRWASYGLCIAAFVAAMLSKPTAVVTPLILLAFGLIALRLPLRRATMLVLPMLLLAIPCAIWTRQVQPARNVHTLVPMIQRPLVASDALAFYVYKLALPLNLAPDYGRSPRWVMQERWAYVSWLLPAALALLVWRQRRELPLVALGACTFVVALLPVLGFVPFDYQGKSTVADHYLYLPMAGVALAAAAIVARFDNHSVRAVAVLALLLWAGISHAQAWHWRATQPLFEHTLAVNPRSWVALTNLSSRALAEERFHDAERLARQAVHAREDHFDAWHNLGSALAQQNRLREAANAYRRAIEANPNVAETHIAYAYAIAVLGQHELAIQHFERALQLEPSNRSARQLLDQLRRHLPAADPPATSPNLPPS